MQEIETFLFDDKNLFDRKKMSIFKKVIKLENLRSSNSFFKLKKKQYKME